MILSFMQGLSINYEHNAKAILDGQDIEMVLNSQMRHLINRYILIGQLQNDIAQKGLKAQLPINEHVIREMLNIHLSQFGLPVVGENELALLKVVQDSMNKVISTLIEKHEARSNSGAGLA